jgi:uncharacterized protein YjbI with pentapeptide repeats
MTPVDTRRWLAEGKLIEFPSAPAEGISPEEWRALRTVSAGWLQSLFDKETGVCVLPVRLRNVVIDGELRLRNRTSKYGFEITDSDFEGLADLSFFCFEGAADFYRSRFHQGARFNSARFKYDLRLIEATLKKESSFQAVEISGRTFSSGAKFENAHFANARFSKSAAFKTKVEVGQQTLQTEFIGDAKFPDARFESSSEFDGVLFSGDVDFSRTTVAGNMIFRPARPKNGLEAFPTEFRGEALFRDVSVIGGADFRGAQFSRDAAFQQMKVGANWLCGSLRRESDVIRTRFGTTAQFDGIQAGARFSLEGAEIVSRCNFEAAHIAGNFLFRGLRDTGAAIDVGGDANFLDARIDGTADFNGARFVGNVTFRRMSVGRSMFLSSLPGKSEPLRASFAASLNCDDLAIQGSLFAQGAVFNKGASFRRMQVGDNGFFSYMFLNGKCLVTEFEELFFFGDARFGGSFNGSGMRCKADAAFDRILVGGTFYCGPAEVEGTAVGSQFGGKFSCVDSDLKGRVDFSGAQFQRGANFARTKFGSGAVFSSVRRGGVTFRTQFAGEQVRFFHADIEGDLECEGVEFVGLADFASVRVKGNASFRVAQFRDAGQQIPKDTVITTFKGGARFVDVSIGGVAEFTGAVFLERSFFNRIKVGGPTFFRRLADLRIMKSPAFQEVQFDGAVFSGGADFDGTHCKGTVSFSEASFGASSRFSRMVCEQNVYLDMAEVEGTATFQYSQFSGDLSLQDARIGTVNFGTSNQDAVVLQKKIDLRGFTYVRIVGDWKELFGRLRYRDLQPYAQLEKMFRGVGNEHDADEVYLARRDAERENLRQSVLAKAPAEGLQRLAWLRAALKLAEDSVLRWIFNYGVPSYRMLWLACALALVGGLILSNPHALEFASKAGTFCERTRIVRFLYGIVSFSDSLLHRSEGTGLTQWRPSNQRFLQNWGPSYRQVASLLSIFVYGSISLAIASLTGLIKRKQS